MTATVVLPPPSVTSSSAELDVVRPDPLQGMSNRQKAAVLVLQLGKQESAKVLGRLTDIQLEDLSAEIARIGSVPGIVSAAVVAEFAGLMSMGSPGSTRGGMEMARDLLFATLGPDKAQQMLDRLAQSFVELPFSFMQNLDPRQIISFLSDEHPQTAALVLAHLPVSLASHVLGGFDREIQAEIAHRVAVMDRTSPDLIRAIESTLQRRLSSLGVASELSAVGGLQPLIDIINRSDRGTEKLILEGLERRDPALAEQIRAQMFMFEDIVHLDDKAIQLILRQVQTNDLATALKGVADAVRDKIMRNMSGRAAENLVEELEMMGPVRLNVVEEAQTGIVRVIRQLEEQGQIVVGRGDEDAFVA